MSQILNTRWLICRICLKSENKKLYNIFEPISDEEIADLGTTLQDKIELCGDIKLQQQLNLPNRICNRCVLLLRAAYKFRDLCQQSQNQLSQFIAAIPQKKELEGNIEINFDSDAEEQQAEVQEESENVILTEDDYVVDEEGGEVEYETEEISSEPNSSKNVNYASTIEEDDAEIPVFSEEDNSSQYVVEEVDVKEFVCDDNDDNDVITTTYKYEDYINSDGAIIVEQSKKGDKQILVNRFNDKKPAVKRKRKYAKDEGFNGVYKCEFCDNTYTEKTKYKNHIKLHIKNKPHECEICKKRFSTTPQLSRHMNSHTGNRPYSCQYCDARFGDPSTKIKHERIHTNERPYKCNFCNKAFAYSNVLKVHLMTHTGEKPYTCDYCGKSFSQQHHKTTHEKRHTNVHTVVMNDGNNIEFMDEEDLRAYKIEEM
ncbi:uncharacterized protein ACRADG_011725 [Cochliomyia hominivorax]